MLVGDREAPFAERSEVDGSLGRCGSLDSRRRANSRRWLAGTISIDGSRVRQRIRLGGDGDDVGYAARLYEACPPESFLVRLPVELSDRGLELTWRAVFQRVNEMIHRLLDMYYSSFCRGFVYVCADWSGSCTLRV